MQPIKKVLCPLDFSPTSYSALKSAQQLAHQVNAEIILLHVISFPAPNNQGFKSEQEASDYARKTAEEQLRQIISTELSHISKGARFLILNGSPAGRLIVDAARDENVDLIVMGTHGWTGWRHLVLGSVTEEVMYRANCPVVTVGKAAIEKWDDAASAVIPTEANK